MARFTIADLEQRIIDRAHASAEDSYTRKLLDKGAAQCAKKFGEEAVETVIEGVGDNPVALVGESADLIYHLLVLWAAAGVSPADVAAELEHREGRSGIEEKRSRANL